MVKTAQPLTIPTVTIAAPFELTPELRHEIDPTKELDNLLTRLARISLEAQWLFQEREEPVENFSSLRVTPVAGGDNQVGFRFRTTPVKENEATPDEANSFLKVKIPVWLAVAPRNTVSSRSFVDEIDRIILQLPVLSVEPVFMLGHLTLNPPTSQKAQI